MDTQTAPAKPPAVPIRDYARLETELRRFIAWRGHPRVPETYVTPEGYELGEAVADARYRNDRETLPEDVVLALWNCGMCWSIDYATKWRDGIDSLTRFIAEHGHSTVPSTHCMDDGHRLGAWLYNATRRWRNGKLSAQETEQLEQLGVSKELRLDRAGLWERHFAALQRYGETHGDLHVPFDYTDLDGINLGQWVRRRREERSRGTLTAAKESALTEIGFIWAVTDREASWQEHCDKLREWAAANGDINSASSALTVDGLPLGKWLFHQRRSESIGKLRADRKSQLAALGIHWTPLETVDAKWDLALVELQDFIRAHSHAEVPARYQSLSGFYLGRWLQRQHKAWRAGTLPEGRVARLEDVGVSKRTRRRPGYQRAASRDGWEMAGQRSAA